MLRRENRKEWVITEAGKDSPNGSKNRARVRRGTIVGFILLCVNIYILMNTHSYLSMLRGGWRLNMGVDARLSGWMSRENSPVDTTTKYKVVIPQGEQIPVSSLLFFCVSAANLSFFNFWPCGPTCCNSEARHRSIRSRLTFALVYWHKEWVISLLRIDSGQVRKEALIASSFIRVPLAELGFFLRPCADSHPHITTSPPSFRPELSLRLLWPTLHASLFILLSQLKIESSCIRNNSFHLSKSRCQMEPPLAAHQSA